MEQSGRRAARPKCRACKEEDRERELAHPARARFEEGRFSPGGFIHLWLSARSISRVTTPWRRMLHFSSSLSDEERDDLTMNACAAASA